MSFEITGRLTEKFETQQISERFQKREFVLEIKESSSGGMEFIDYIKFQATQDKCSLLDNIQVNDQVKVSFNLRGRKWEKEGRVSYFTNLDAWRIEKSQSDETTVAGADNSNASSGDAPFPTAPPETDSGFDDLPF